MQTNLLNLHCRGATGYAAKPNIRKIENKALIYGNKKECWDSNHGLVTGPQHSFAVFQPQSKSKNYVWKIKTPVYFKHTSWVRFMFSPSTSFLSCAKRLRRQGVSLRCFTGKEAGVWLCWDVWEMPVRKRFGRRKESQRLVSADWASGFADDAVR